MTKEEVSEYNRRIAEQNKMYCYCRGKRGKDPDDFYVMCDSQNCENNNWYHWKCIEELRFKTRQELEEMEHWFCPTCREKQDNTNEKAEGSSNKKSEGKRCFKFMRFLSILLSLRNNICNYRNGNVDTLQAGRRYQTTLCRQPE